MDPSAAGRSSPGRNQNPPIPPWLSDSTRSHDAQIAMMARDSVMRSLSPGHPRSLSGIALRAFCLGASLTAGAISVLVTLLLTDSPIWRVPFFLCALSAFHFLEFWTTSRGNPTAATVGSYLLTANWPAYAIAHTAAFLECAVVSLLFPERSWASPRMASCLLALGLLLTFVGQGVRSMAMLHAGESFNHHIQTRRVESHALVTTGIYGWMRHPSYAAFFYWGLGTQLVLGNVCCFVGYAAVLWMFFSERIRIEEEKLVEFFQQDYVSYRKRVGTYMPFIR